MSPHIFVKNDSTSISEKALYSFFSASIASQFLVFIFFIACQTRQFLFNFFTTFQCPSFNLFSILSNSSNFTFFQFCSHCFARFDESFSLVHCHLSLKGFICDFKGCRQKRSMRRINPQAEQSQQKKLADSIPVTCYL